MSAIPEPQVTVVGPDPGLRRQHALNGAAFQQDALTSLNGWQYAAFYSPISSSALTDSVISDGSSSSTSTTSTPVEPVYVHLARRQLPRGQWSVFVFEDYAQTADDGHNTVQIGVCAGDGTIHLSWDHHCDV
jgi:hypothetical protein